MAPVSDVTYVQSWTIAIRPGDGDEPWPALIPEARGGPVIDPDVIFVFIEPDREPVISGSGIRRKRDGTAGSLRMNTPWDTPDAVPAWVRKLAAEAMRRHGLDGRLYHLAVPLPGSVLDQAGSPVPGTAAARCYPLAAMCSQCHDRIQLMTGSGEWLHTAVLPDWMQA